MVESFFDFSESHLKWWLNFSIIFLCVFSLFTFLFCSSACVAMHWFIIWLVTADTFGIVIWRHRCTSTFFCSKCFVLWSWFCFRVVNLMISSFGSFGSIIEHIKFVFIYFQKPFVFSSQFIISSFYLNSHISWIGQSFNTVHWDQSWLAFVFSHFTRIDKWPLKMNEQTNDVSGETGREMPRRKIRRSHSVQYCVPFQSFFNSFVKSTTEREGEEKEEQNT